VSNEHGNPSVIYEVTLDADALIEADFDTWLRDHIADMLQIDGFLAAEILEDRSQRPDGIRRIVQYRVRGREALENYFRDHAPRMRAQGLARFGERFTVERRVLEHREQFMRGAVSTENCRNCGEVLTGQHCSHCGQRAQVQVLSLGALLRDLLGDLVNFDSRLWRTLWPLAAKPGHLTREYLRGRRASYTPPFRMYLLMSLVFFLIASLEGGAARGAKVLEGHGATPPTPGQSSQGAATGETAKPVAPQNSCDSQNMQITLPEALQPFEPRLRQACRNIVSDSQGFSKALLRNVPKMMFIFLPLIAGVMFLLYIGSGRYYVEHLLFVVHFHTCFFFGASVLGLLEIVAALLKATPVAAPLTTLVGVGGSAFMVYLPWYLYCAMRNVYGQSRTTTLLKLAALGLGYLLCLALTATGRATARRDLDRLDPDTRNRAPRDPATERIVRRDAIDENESTRNARGGYVAQPHALRARVGRHTAGPPKKAKRRRAPQQLVEGFRRAALYILPIEHGHDCRNICQRHGQPSSCYDDAFQLCRRLRGCCDHRQEENSQ